MAEMLINKIERHENPFLQMDKKPLFSKKYSWAEKGMLACLLACKSGKIKLTDMHNFAEEGERTTRTIQQKLKAKGHLVVVNEGGKWYSEVHEIPLETPVLTYEKRQKREDKLSDILKKRGLSSDDINAILAELDGGETNKSAAQIMPINTDSDSKPKGEATSKQHDGAGVNVAPAIAENKPKAANKEAIFTSDERAKVTASYVSEMKEDKGFLVTLTKNYGVETNEHLSELLNEFLNRPITLGQPNISNYKAFAQHFYNWIPKAAKAKKQAENLKKKPKNGVILPTPEEIKTELQRSLKMVYSVQDEQFTYFKESVLSVIEWAKRAEKLKIVLDEDTTRKAIFYLGTEGASEKRLLEIYNGIVKHNAEKAAAQT